MAVTVNTRLAEAEARGLAELAEAAGVTKYQLLRMLVRSACGLDMRPSVRFVFANEFDGAGQLSTATRAAAFQTSSPH